MYNCIEYCPSLAVITALYRYDAVTVITLCMVTLLLHYCYMGGWLDGWQASLLYSNV